MNIYEKLQNAKVELQEMKIQKSGHNKFSNYDYFELKDFLPTVNKLFIKHKLCDIVRFNDTEASLTIVDIEKPEDSITYTSPMKELEIKGANAIQALGGVQTYQRRYLWLAAMGIVEADSFDAVPHNTPKQSTISQVQQKVLVEYLNKGVSKEAAQGILNSYGYQKSTEVRAEDYEKIRSAFEGAI